MKSCPRCSREVGRDASFCVHCGAYLKSHWEEEYPVSSDGLIEKVKKLIHEGNVRRILVKNEEGKILLEIPVTIGIIGVILAPWLAALGVIAAIASKCTVVVERREKQT
ncbi:MAG: DUF4342 domain-containing protein [Promethearchaeota archaeon]